MVVLGGVAAAVAAAIHVAIFWLESVAWMRPRTRAVFGIASEDDARVTRALAFNQGFYNLFLAIAAAVGLALNATGHSVPGATLVLSACGIMLAAALVLLASGGRRFARAAAIQGVAPLIAVVALTVDLLG